MPYRIHKNTELPIDVIKNRLVDLFVFMSHVYTQESVGAYLNAVKLAGIYIVLPYAETLECRIDYSRIHSGNNKYTIRGAFQRM